MQLSSLAPALRGQQSMQVQTQNNGLTATTLSSAVNDAFHKTSTQKAPQFGCFGLFKQKDINARDAQGRTAIARAAWHGDAKKILKLVRKGADVSIADNKGDFPLLIAARNNNVAVAQALSGGRNFSVNQQNQDKRDQKLSGHERRGETALISATILGNTNMVEFLVGQGADVNRRTNVIDKGGIFATGGYTALETARSLQRHAPQELADRYSEIIRLLEVQPGVEPIMSPVNAIPPFS